MVFFFGSALLSAIALHLTLHLYNAMTISPGSKPSDLTMILGGLIFILVTSALGMVGLILGVLGRLPGTRRKGT